MANWRIHNNIAVKCRELLDVENLNEYLVGAIFPDSLRLQKGYDSSLIHELHSYLPDAGIGSFEKMDLFRLPNLAVFVSKYKEQIKKYDFFKGWFTHLCVDYIFNEYANRKVLLISEDKIMLNCLDGIREFDSQKIAIAFKQDDFAAYSVNLIATNLHSCLLPQEVNNIVFTLIQHDLPILDIVTTYNEIVGGNARSADTLLFTRSEYEQICLRCQQYIDVIYDAL